MAVDQPFPRGTFKVELGPGEHEVFHSGSKSRLGGFGMNGVPTDGTSGAS